MKYLRLFIVFLTLGGMGYAPVAMAYADMWLGNSLLWEKTVYADTGENANGDGPTFNTSIAFMFDFPNLNIDMEQPLASPWTLSLTQPTSAIFYNYHTMYDVSWANVEGYVTYESDWQIREWNFRADMFMTDSLYGTFTSFGTREGAGDGYHFLSESVMKLHFDDYQPRWFVEPFDIIEYSRNYGLEIYLTDRGITAPVPESPSLFLLLSSLILLLARRVASVLSRRSFANNN